MPSRHRSFAREAKLPSWWANRIQDRLGSLALIRLRRANATTVEVAAGAGDDAAVLSIEGRWRIRETSVSRTAPAGAAGTFVIWAVATDNQIVDTPQAHTDETDYGFDLRITTGAAPPIEAGVVEIRRRIGSYEWTGSAITTVSPEIGALPAAQPLGGVLSGTPANAPFAQDMATQAELTGDSRFRTAPDDFTVTDRHYLGAQDDTWLFRHGPGTPGTPGDFVARSGVGTQTRIGQVGPAGQAGISLDTSDDVRIFRAGVDRAFVDAQLESQGHLVARQGTAGQVLIGDPAATGGRPGLLLGSVGDTGLHRQQPGVLATGDSFRAAGTVYAADGGPERIVIGPVGQTQDRAAVLFGLAGDVAAYRARPNELATDALLRWHRNVAGLSPVAAEGGALGWNYTGGASEVDFFNTAATVGGESFRWLRRNSSGAYRTQMILRDSGRLDVASGEFGRPDQLGVALALDNGTNRSYGELDLRSASGSGAGTLRFGGGDYGSRSPENLRWIRGSVAADGSIVTGSGFTVTRTSTGIYQLTFTAPFQTFPTVVPQATNVSTDASVQVQSTAQAQVLLDFDGTLFNSAFNFVAAG